jgi:hypothetical protein
VVKPTSLVALVSDTDLPLFNVERFVFFAGFTANGKSVGRGVAKKRSPKASFFV